MEHRTCRNRTACVHPAGASQPVDAEHWRTQNHKPHSDGVCKSCRRVKDKLYAEHRTPEQKSGRNERERGRYTAKSKQGRKLRGQRDTARENHRAAHPELGIGRDDGLEIHERGTPAMSPDPSKENGSAKQWDGVELTAAEIEERIEALYDVTTVTELMTVWGKYLYSLGHPKVVRVYQDTRRQAEDDRLPKQKKLRLAEAKAEILNRGSGNGMEYIVTKYAAELAASSELRQLAVTHADRDLDYSNERDPQHHIG